MRPNLLARSECEPDNPFTNLLARLLTAHEELLSCIEFMERVTNAPMPNVEQLTSARFKISRASRARRAVWHEICDRLQAKHAGAGDPLRKLIEGDLELSALSSKHVSRWPLQTILGDWNGYQRASRNIRRAIARAIETERTLLVPLLRAYC